MTNTEKVIRLKWNDTSYSEHIVRTLSKIESFQIWDPEQLNQVHQTQTTDFLIQRDDFARMLSKRINSERSMDFGLDRTKGTSRVLFSKSINAFGVEGTSFFEFTFS